MKQIENDYIKLFEKRGKQYHKAMTLYPNARDEEFLQAIQKIKFNHPLCVGDIPAGGEYLRKFLPVNSLYFPHEPCSGFYSNNHPSQMLLPLPFPKDSLDVVFSIAGIHHLEDKSKLFKEIYQAIKPDGYFVVSDVQEDSCVAKFLDGFMGKHNSTGHSGIFLNDKTPTQLTQCGFEVISVLVKKFYWVFDTLEDMAIFCNTLFDMCYSDIQKTIDAIKKNLGVVTLENNQIGMNWELMTIVAKKVSLQRGELV